MHAPRAEAAKAVCGCKKRLCFLIGATIDDDDGPSITQPNQQQQHSPFHQCKNRRAHSHTSSGASIWFDEFPIKPFHTRRNWRCGEASGASHNVWTGRTQTFARTVPKQPSRSLAAYQKSWSHPKGCHFFPTINSLKPFIRVLRANQIALKGWMNFRPNVGRSPELATEKLCAFQNSLRPFIQESIFNVVNFIQIFAPFNESYLKDKLIWLSLFHNIRIIVANSAIASKFTVLNYEPL